MSFIAITLRMPFRGGREDYIAAMHRAAEQHERNGDKVAAAAITRMVEAVTGASK